MPSDGYSARERLRAELAEAPEVFAVRYGALSPRVDDAKRVLESGTTAELRNLKCQVRSIFEQRAAEIAGLERENARLRAEVAGHAAALLESAVPLSRLLSEHRPADALTLLLNDALVALDMGAIKMVHDECHLERFRDRVTP